MVAKKEDMRKLRSIMVAVLLLLFISPQLMAEGEQLRVMTFNIRYDNKGDSAQQWSLRKAGVAQLLNSQAIDLLGAQEGNSPKTGVLWRFIIVVIFAVGSCSRIR